MTVTQIADRLHVVRGIVNVYLIELDEGLALIDCGFPGSPPKILAAVQALGRKATDVRHIILTHAHPDHIGGAGEMKRQTGAAVWANPIDAPIMRAGTGFRPVHATPGLRAALMTKLALGWIKKVQPVEVDHFLEDGDRPAFLPDLLTIHAPGHCAGQNAFLWQRGAGFLFVADSCVNLRGPKLPPACEDLDLTRQTLERMKELSYEAVCFMHGPPVLNGGDTLLRQTNFG